MVNLQVVIWQHILQSLKQSKYIVALMYYIFILQSFSIISMKWLLIKLSIKFTYFWLLWSLKGQILESLPIQNTTIYQIRHLIIKKYTDTRCLY